MKWRAAWLGTAVVALPIAACSLLTEVDGLTTPVTPVPADAGALDSSTDSAAAEASADPDASSDAGVPCRPGFTGVGCTTACPTGTAGDACDYRLVLGLDIPVIANWLTAASVPYSDNATASAGVFSRIGYRLILDTEEVWVELDAFTQDATRVGIPADWVFQQPVANVIVHSFAVGQSNVLVPTAGNVELWSSCYTPGDAGTYDSDDVITDNDCYGSFQIHVAKQPVLCFNDWSGGTVALDVGIGPAPATEKNPDWTFSKNAGRFTKRRLEVYVR